MGTEINEKVKVWAFFDETPSKGTTIFPIAISWRRRFIKINKLIFTSSQRVGNSRSIRLVCEADSGNYELELNTDNYLWELKKIMPKE